MADKGYHSGGGSYVLSRESLRRFYQAYNESPSKCRTDGGYEDVEIARCLRTKGVYPGNSLDEQNRERFHHLTFDDHFRGKWPHWFLSFVENPPQTVGSCMKVIFSFRSMCLLLLRDTIAVVNKRSLFTMLNLNNNI